MQIGICDRMDCNRHPTYTQNYAVIYDGGGTFYEYKGLDEYISVFSDIYMCCSFEASDTVPSLLGGAR